ncbi:MAG TPA: hypothetical protein RMH85_22310 [Polyangiaceae bacterium LLY-WYZ-15_(1-7)]|nr:hypothetical protein [Sandaracinus sp.]HJK91743.1 hypothetical protein [Polyangiaceae bacterium LLY-WYZ-15_(1-7)]HJL03288.1 hypothetical protein [Polyangiaceae bacterium LLY-WYZ-15_(1-7)]HJL11224.1 hypothetical protein [Polyangiaceae bacterium LLY-WYZ-15_(1-7)]HJL26607.1 hypothetical protein [Polyangiaceae bacterium LLY-WYZ-15_(1-7)]
MMRWVEVFEGLYGRAPVGCGEAALVAAEARLGVELPAELRGFLSAVGREAVVMEVHDRFLAPDALAVADGRVVFCEENQGVCMWGCAVGELAPRVEVGNLVHAAEPVGLEWHLEEVELETFLEERVVLQAAFGGFPHGATVGLQGADEALARGWEERVRRGCLRVHGRPGVLVVSFAAGGALSVAARTEAELERACDELRRPD